MNKEIEKEIDKQNIIFSQNPNIIDNQKYLKKEIIYDMDRDKYYLYNKENSKKIQTNYFGQKIPKINISQEGKASYNERLKAETVEKIINKIDDSLYRPRMKNFDGFAQIPRPLVPAFCNDKLLKSNKDIINYIKRQNTIISIKKFQKLFNRNNNDNISGLEYYSGTISNLKNDKSKNIILKYIEDNINNNNLSKKEIESLKKFKNNLLINSTNIINGRELNRPKDIFLKKYKVNHNVMFVNPVKNKNKDMLINLNTYHLLYKSINNNPLTYLKNKNMINSAKTKNKKKYIIARPKSVINIKYNNKLYNTLNNNNKLDKNNNNIKKNIDKSNYIFLPEKHEFKNNESKRYDTEEDYKDTFNKNRNNNELSLSQSINGINPKSNIHYFLDLKKYYKNEKNHLIGYQKPFRKEIPLIRKGNPKYKSTGELYKKDLDLFKLVNPEKLKIEEDENNKHINYLKKKIEKEKIVKIVKYKKLMGKNSRIHSAISNLGKDYNDI